jgi:hypothetical protein
MRVSLVTYIPYQSIMRGIQHLVQGQRQFDDTETRSKMTATGGNRLDQLFPYFLGYRRKKGVWQYSQRRWVVNRIQ